MKLSITAALFATASIFAAPAANAQGFGTFYAFGDSLTDCCVTGPYTNSKAPNWAAQLPGLIGASYNPSRQTNTAIGGAQSGNNNASPFLETFLGVPTGFLPQVARFQAEGMTITSRDIAGIWIGTNDIWPSAIASPNLATVGLTPLGVRPDVTAFGNYVAGNVRSGINSLVASGFRSIVLVSPYDLSLSEVYSGQGVVADATLRSLASQYSIEVRNQLANLYTPGVNTYFLDTLTLLNRVQATPSTYGFTHVLASDSCSASPTCVAAPVSEQNKYVFNDIIHVTSGFDALMSRYISNIINAREGLSAPGDISMGAGISFSNMLLDRLNVQRRSFGSPTDAQASMVTKATRYAPVSDADRWSFYMQAVGGNISRIGASNNGPANADLNADLVGALIGADYAFSRNIRVGGAFNFINSNTKLPGLSGTHIDSNNFQGGIYGSISYPNYFLDAALTLGANRIDTARTGIIDTPTASLDGSTLTFAGRTGYLFDIGSSFKAGPIAELTYANVHIGSYSERGDSLLTLGVKNQNFDGLTGGVGAQVKGVLYTPFGAVNPFVNLTAQHDFFGGIRSITSFSTDAPALLINTNGGHRLDDLYGKISGGFELGLSNGWTGTFSGASTFGRSYGNDYAVNGGVKYQF